MVAAPQKNFLRRHRLMSAVVLVLLALAGLFAYGFSNLNPLLINMAEARARQLAVEAINQAVAEAMATSITYTDLMNITLDGEGHVAMLTANTSRMNELSARAILIAQRNLGALADQGVSLPIGAALGIEMLSSSGPRIRVDVVPVGSVTMSFITAFESAGINQTRHEISLEARVLMRIVIPNSAGSVEVNAYVPIAESIIVGQVPNTFINIPSSEGMMNLAP